MLQTVNPDGEDGWFAGNDRAASVRSYHADGAGIEDWWRYE
jgi:hypothetical protein